MQALQLVWTGYLFLHENLLGPIAKAKSILIIWEYEWREIFVPSYLLLEINGFGKE